MLRGTNYYTISSASLVWVLRQFHFAYNSLVSIEGWTVAGEGSSEPRGRKVRAPQDRVVDNVHRSQDQGKCNRK